jgi:hypothetical protein
MNSKEIEVEDVLEIIADDYGHGFPIGTKVTVWAIYANTTGRKSYMSNAGIRNRHLLEGEFKSIKK